MSEAIPFDPDGLLAAALTSLKAAADAARAHYEQGAVAYMEAERNRERRAVEQAARGVEIDRVALEREHMALDRERVALERERHNLERERAVAAEERAQIAAQQRERGVHG